jgi:hypothetical protein
MPTCIAIFHEIRSVLEIMIGIHRLRAEAKSRQRVLGIEENRWSQTRRSSEWKTAQHYGVTGSSFGICNNEYAKLFLPEITCVVSRECKLKVVFYFPRPLHGRWLYRRENIEAELGVRWFCGVEGCDYVYNANTGDWVRT